jgi:hypothetical protein
MSLECHASTTAPRLLGQLAMQRVPLVSLWLVAAACSSPDASERIEVAPGQADEPAPGKADGRAEVRVELKVTLDPGDIGRARDLFALDDGELRWVHFYDTPALDLFERGVILRARKIVGDDDDSTVKIRPLAAADVDGDWHEVDGFKCEIDRTPSASVSSCSLSDRQGPAEIGRVAQGDRSIATLFDDAQELFLATHAPDAPGFAELYDLGRVETMVWKVDSSHLDETMTFELWHLPDGTDILEVSIKVDADDADDELDDLLEYLDDHDLRVGAAQETKTRAALEQLAAWFAQ